MFIHFFHHQTLKLYQLDRRAHSRRALIDLLGSALRWSVFLSPRGLIVPSSDLVQSPIIGEFISDLQLLSDAGIIEFVGSSPDPEVLQELHRAQFESTSLQQVWERNSIPKRIQRFDGNLRGREFDTTTYVRMGWDRNIEALASTSTATQQYPIAQLINARKYISSNPSPSTYETALAGIPQRLGNRAFLWELVEQFNLFDFPASSAAQWHFELALAWNWIRSYIDEYQTQIVGRVRILGSIDCGLRHTNPEAVVNLDAYESAAKVMGLSDAFHALTLDDVINLRDDLRVIVLRNELLTPLSFAFTMPDFTQKFPSSEFVRACNEIKDAVCSANNPCEAMTLAADSVVRWSERKPSNVPEIVGAKNYNTYNILGGQMGSVGTNARSNNVDQLQY